MNRSVRLTETGWAPLLAGVAGTGYLLNKIRKSKAIQDWWNGR